MFNVGGQSPGGVIFLLEHKNQVPTTRHLILTLTLQRFFTESKQVNQRTL